MVWLSKIKLCWKCKTLLYECRQLDVKTHDIYKGTAEDIETRFHTSNFELGRSLPKEKIKNEIGLMKDELGEQLIKEFVSLIAKTYGYLKGNKAQKSVS